ANSGTFGTGQGYSIKRDATTNGYVSFAGTLKTDNLLSTITQNSGVNNWNLEGNPYASYILVSDLVTSNSTNLTGTHQTVYVFDNNKSGGAGYVALTGTDYIHPGQGFFVNAANSTASNFTIDATKLSHQTGKTLYKNATISKPFIKLMMTDGSNNDYTSINYLEGKTQGLDPSFDVGTFTGTANNFSIYSHLVSNSQGVDFTRQSLPNSDYENMIIPIGMKASTGKEITFSAEALNLPKDIKVFLEDRLENTFTRLDETNSEYKITLSEDVNGVGRFYIHTTQSSLSVDVNVLLDNINVYKSNVNTLTIVGLQQGNTNVKLFNILGEQVLNTSFNSNGAKDVSLPKLTAGVYIVQLLTDAGKLNKKIILE
ncbi:MAG: T9SS type A sorting domain-containing protein, partial [Polaribacter sp.]